MNIKKWWREWARFDVLVLGIGTALSGGYIIFRAQNPAASSPILDLWSNLAFGIVGTWLSIRFIDSRIQAREHRQTVRRTIISNLNYIRSEVQKLLPRVYDFSIKTLENELMWATERYPNRKAYLGQGERGHLEAVLAKLKRLLDDAATFTAGDQTVRNARYRIERMTAELNEHRSSLMTKLDHLRANEALPADFSTDNKEYLTNAELNQLTAFSQQVALRISQPAASSNPIERPDIRPVYLNTLRWFTEVEHTYTQFHDEQKFDNHLILQASDAARIHITADDIPPLLSSPLSDYLEAISAAIQQRSNAEADVIELTQAIDAARFDIMEELEID